MTWRSKRFVTMGTKYELEEGLELDPFEKTAYWNRGQFEDYSLSGYGERQLVQFKLHGSVDWMEVGEVGPHRSRSRYV